MILPHTSVNLRKRDYLLLMELPAVYGNAFKTAEPKKEQRAGASPASPSQPHGNPSRVSSPPVVAGSTDFAVLLYLTEGIPFLFLLLLLLLSYLRLRRLVHLPCGRGAAN